MEKFDLVIVGTGFGASFFLKKYLEKSPPSRKVLVLERGIMFPHAERLKERRREKIAEEYAKAGSYIGTYEYHNSDKTWVFEPNFGGSSNCWTGCTPRFLPNDFKMKSLYGVGQDWPIGYTDIAPYYDEAEEIMMIGGPALTPFPGISLIPFHLKTIFG